MNEIMDHPQIDDDAILDRYLVGRLSDEHEALFEEHLFSCASCLERVQWGEELRRGLRAVAAEDAARATAVRATAARATAAVGLMAWLRGRGRAPHIGIVGLALACALLVAVAWWQQVALNRFEATTRQAAQQATQGSGLKAPLGDLLVVSLGVVRDGDAEVATIRRDLEKEAVLLSLELPAVDAARYRVRLRDANGTVRWQGDDLEPNLYDTLLVVLPTDFLAPGRYRITIEAQGEAGARAVGEMALQILE